MKKTSKSNPLLSILVVVALFLILFAASAGIWFLLKGEDEKTRASTIPETAMSDTPPHGSASASAAEEAIVGGNEAPPTNEETGISDASVTTPPAAGVEDLRPKVSQYLEYVYIGAVRTGTKARVMLNEKNYEIGDLIQEATGLVFMGTRDKKLVFKDRNGVLYMKSF